MYAASFNRHILTNAYSCNTLLLTIFICVLAHCSNAKAFEYYQDQWPDVSSSSRPSLTPLADQDRSNRIRLMRDYAKTLIPTIAPGLPSYISNPGSWAYNGLGIVRQDESIDGVSSFLQPVQSSFQQPSVDAPEALWLSPGYHHRGFLPIHDAMLMGIHLRHTPGVSLDGNSLQFDVHPFVGQSWRSLDDYWGTEVGFSLRHASSPQPWGKIAISFTQGDNQLMDHGHGFDMHTEFNFNEHLSLNAGVRENYNSDAGNYVMVRWKLVDGF